MAETPPNPEKGEEVYVEDIDDNNGAWRPQSNDVTIQNIMISLGEDTLSASTIEQRSAIPWEKFTMGKGTIATPKSGMKANISASLEG